MFSKVINFFTGGNEIKKMEKEFHDAFENPKTSWMALDREERLPATLERAKVIAPVINGEVKVRDDGDKVHIVGQFQGYSCRAVIWATFGSTDIELKLNQPRNDDAFPFWVRAKHKYTKLQEEQNQQGRDEWDDADFGEMKFFLGKHTYIEGDADELPGQQRAVSAIPEELRHRIVQHIEPDEGSLGLYSDKVSISYDRKYLFNHNAAAEFQKALELLAAVAVPSEQYR